MKGRASRGRPAPGHAHRADAGAARGRHGLRPASPATSVLQRLPARPRRRPAQPRVRRGRPAAVAISSRRHRAGDLPDNGARSSTSDTTCDADAAGRLRPDAGRRDVATEPKPACCEDSPGPGIYTAPAVNGGGALAGEGDHAAATAHLRRRRAIWKRSTRHLSGSSSSSSGRRRHRAHPRRRWASRSYGAACGRWRRSSTRPAPSPPVSCRRVPDGDPRTEVGRLGRRAERDAGRRSRARSARRRRGRPEVGGPAAPVRRRRLARAAHPAHLDPRLRRALPAGRRPTPTRTRRGDAPDRERGGPDGRAGRRPAAARPARPGPAARARPVDLRGAGGRRRARRPGRRARPRRSSSTSWATRRSSSGDEVRLRQVVGNLLANALVHTPGERRSPSGWGRRRDGASSRWRTRGPASPDDRRAGLRALLPGRLGPLPPPVGRGRGSGLGLAIVAGAGTGAQRDRTGAERGGRRGDVPSRTPTRFGLVVQQFLRWLCHSGYVTEPEALIMVVDDEPNIWSCSPPACASPGSRWSPPPTARRPSGGSADPARPGRAGRDAAGPGRVRGGRRLRARHRRAGAVPDRPRRHRGQGRRADRRRRRLRDQAVQPGGGPGPDPRRAPPYQRGDRDPPTA